MRRVLKLGPGEYLYRLWWWLAEVALAAVTALLLIFLAVVVAIVSLPIAILAVLRCRRNRHEGVGDFYRKQMEFWISMCRDIIP